MPASYVVTGRATRTYAGPDGLGKMLHAWLFGRIKRWDAALARTLHESSELKPFTISPVRGAFRQCSRGTIQVLPGCECWFRWTWLDPVTESLSDAIAEELPGERIVLGPLEMEVEAVYTREEEHPWAGRMSYADLWDHNIAREDPVLVLRFESPTTFRSQGRNRPLPGPELVFRTLLDKWQRWSAVDLSGLEEVLNRQIDIASFRIRSERMEGNRYPEVGFVGSVAYSLRRVDPLLRGAVHALASYAFFAGVGAKTAMGFGQVRSLHPAVTAREVAGDIRS